MKRLVEKAAGVALLFLLLFPVAGWTDWQVLSNCTLIDNESNDGDSFHVEHEGREYIFRLYFVDAPESSDQISDRIIEQANYWNADGHQVLKAGARAKDFTRDQLKNTFTIYTQWHDARGMSKLPRYYAIVVTCDGNDLASLLVEQGLARVYGMKTSHPKGMTSDQVRDQLFRSQSYARMKHAGIWKDIEKGNSIFTNAYESVFAEKGRTFLCSKNLSVRSDKAPHAYIGYLTSGTEIFVEEVLPHGVIIRAKLNNGDERECFCNRFELAAAVPGVL